MKKAARIFIGLGMISTLLLTTGCFGKFALTRKVYAFNDSLGGNDMGGKLVKTLVFWVMNIIPVYGVAGMIDIVILNLIEFWTGTNPLAMTEGQKEIQYVQRGAIQYEITATKNKFEVKQLNGDKKGEMQSVTFNPTELAWYNTSNGVSTKLIQYQVENGVMVSATYYGTNGQSVVMNEKQLNNMFATVAMK